MTKQLATIANDHAALERDEQAATEKFTAERARIESQRNALNAIRAPLGILRQDLAALEAIKQRLAAVIEAQVIARDEYQNAFRAAVRHDLTPPPNIFWLINNPLLLPKLSGKNGIRYSISVGVKYFFRLGK